MFGLFRAMQANWKLSRAVRQLQKENTGLKEDVVRLMALNGTLKARNENQAKIIMEYQNGVRQSPAAGSYSEDFS